MSGPAQPPVAGAEQRLAGGRSEPLPAAGDSAPLPAVVALPVALVLTLLLTVWGAFLVPFRIGTVAVPVWLLPVAGMGVVGAIAARSAGWRGASVPALLWLVVTWQAFAARRAEGDLVIPGSLPGYGYLLCGVAVWAVVVVRASARDRSRAGRREALQPGS